VSSTIRIASAEGTIAAELSLGDTVLIHNSAAEATIRRRMIACRRRSAPPPLSNGGAGGGGENGVDFSTAYVDRQPDGSFSQPQGRWSDWLFPPGSFGAEPGTFERTPVLAMSVSGMIAMKEQYPHLRNGGPWRQKDIDDLEILRGLAAAQL
jgi:hypothetical protein